MIKCRASVLRLFMVLLIGSLLATAVAKVAIGRAADTLPPYPVIDATNVEQLKELAVLGRGIALQVSWMSETSLAIVSSVGVWVYDIADPEKEPLLLPVSTEEILDMALSADGNVLVMRHSGPILTLYDFVTGTQRPIQVEINEWPTRLALNTDGSRLAIGGASGTISLWDTITGDRLQTYEHDIEIIDLGFNSDGSVLASVDGSYVVRLWDIETGTVLQLPKAGGRVTFSPDGTMVATWFQRSSNVNIWSSETGTLIATLENKTYLYFDSIAFNSENNLIIGDREKVQLWNIETQEVSLLTDQMQGAYSVSVNPKLPLFSGVNNGGTAWILNIETKEVLAVFQNFTSFAYQAIFSPDGTFIVAGYRDGIRGWELENFEQITGFYYGIPAHNIALGSDNTLLAVAINYRKHDTEGPVLLLDMVARTLVLVSNADADLVLPKVAFSPDSTLLAFGGEEDDSIRLWDVTTHQEIGSLQGHTDRVTSVDFDSTGTTLASASQDGTVRLWDVSSQSLLSTATNPRTFGLLSAAVLNVAFSSDDNLVAAANEDGTVKVWRVLDGKHIAILETGYSKFTDHRFYDIISNPNHIAFSPDGTLLATPGFEHGKSVIQLWNPQTGEKLTALQGHKGVISSVAFSPDGTLLISASGDGTIRIWGVQE